MKKFFEVLIQSNTYFQVAFCALNRLFKIIKRLPLLFLLLFIVAFSFYFKNPLLLVLESICLWHIVGMAKPSLSFPSPGSFVTVSSIGLLCSLYFLLKSLETQFFLGIFLSFFIVLFFLFLMNEDSNTSFKQNIVHAFMCTGLFVWYELFVLSVTLALLYTLSWALHSLLIVHFLILGYVLVFIQLIIVKSLCENNDSYYYQGF